MSYPRLPDNNGEYAHDDGRIPVSRERFERLHDKLYCDVMDIAREALTPGAMAAIGNAIKARLEKELRHPGPSLDLTPEAHGALAELIAGAALGDYVIATAADPTDAAARHLNRLFDVRIKE